MSSLLHASKELSLAFFDWFLPPPAPPFKLILQNRSSSSFKQHATYRMTCTSVHYSNKLSLSPTNNIIIIKLRNLCFMACSPICSLSRSKRRDIAPMSLIQFNNFARSASTRNWHSISRLQQQPHRHIRHGTYTEERGKQNQNRCWFNTCGASQCGATQMGLMKLCKIHYIDNCWRQLPFRASMKMPIAHGSAELSRSFFFCCDQCALCA